MTMTQLPPSKKPRLTTEYIITHLLRFYKSPSSMSFRKFCNDINLPRSNLAKIWKSSGLHAMKEKRKKLELEISITLELHLNVRE